MQPHDLIETARLLLGPDDAEPTEANLRRAISTAYYALFHFMCRECADRLVGCTDAQQKTPAWRQTYRALEHGKSKERCQTLISHQGKANRFKFPKEIENFSALFKSLQELRHRADYDIRPVCSKTTARAYIDDASDMIDRTKKVAAKHRKAFAVYLTMPMRDKNGH